MPLETFDADRESVRMLELLERLDSGAAAERRAVEETRDRLSAEAEILRLQENCDARELAGQMITRATEAQQNGNVRRAVSFLKPLWDGKVGQMTTEQRRGAGMAYAKACMAVHDFETAERVLHTLCDGFRTLRPDAAMVDDAMFARFQSIWMQKRDETHDFLIEKRLIPFIRQMERDLGSTFGHILNIIKMTLAASRGAFDEAVEMGRTGERMGLFTPRLNAEKARIMGMARFTKVERSLGSLEALEGPSRMEAETHLLAQLQEARGFCEEAMRSLHAMPDFVTEIGAFARASYNHAKTLHLITRVRPGSAPNVQGAMHASGRLRQLATSIGNAEIVGRTHLLDADTLRYGRHRPPTPDDLKEAALANIRVVDMDNVRPMEAIAAMINFGEIYHDLYGPEAARPYVARAVRLYHTSGDLRLQTWAEDELRALAGKVGVPFATPGH